MTTIIFLLKAEIKKRNQFNKRIQQKKRTNLKKITYHKLKLNVKTNQNL